MKKSNLQSLALLATACCCVSLSAKQKKAERPNIVLFNIDDMGYADVSCFGEQRWKTEYIDSLANHGMKLTDFYSCSPISSPSRAGLLTGRYPARMGIEGVFFPESYTGMAPEEVTIAEVLKPQGYVTGIVGKWHLGHFKKFLPLQQGFDEYFGIPYSNDMKGQVYLRGNDVVDFHVDQRYMTRRYTEESIKFINKHSDEPFFLYIPHNMMHAPQFCSPEFEGKSGHGVYGDAVLELDWGVGQVMEALRANGIEEKTLVIFVSDNGPSLNEGPRGGSAGILREGKRTDYEGGVRIPCIMYWKGHIKPSVHDGVASNLDILPTLATLCGAELPDVELDGQDISGVLLGTGKRANQDYVYMADNNGVTGLRCGDWKLSLPYHAIQGNFWRATSNPRDTVLVNLKKDPSETTDVIDKYPKQARKMIERLQHYQKVFSNLPEPLVQGRNYEGPYLERMRKSDIAKAKARGVESRENEVLDYIMAE